MPDHAIGWLLDHDYQVVRLDASAWTREEDLHTAIAQALHFPDYYGRNLDALNDCLTVRPPDDPPQGEAA